MSGVRNGLYYTLKKWFTIPLILFDFKGKFIGGVGG